MAGTDLATLGIKVDPRDAVAGADKASKAINKIGTASKKATDKLKAMGSRMAKVGSVALAGFAVVTVKTAAEFEESMNKVSAIGGHTGETLEAMTNQAKELGRTTAFSASQAADAMTFLSMAGFDAQETMASMPGVLALAAASGTDLAASADIASNILSGLGLKAEETGRLVDVMAKASSSANMNVMEMGEAFKMVAPMADVAGLSMEGMSALIGKMADAGIKGTMAGTGLKAAIARLLDPTDKMQAAFDGLGLSINNPDGSMRNFIDILADMETAGASAIDYVQIFGREAGPKLMAATKGGIDAVKELRTKLQESGGTAQEMADIQLQGLSGNLKKLKSAFEGMQLAIADSGLLEWVTKITIKLTEFIPKVVEFASQHPLLTKVGVALTAVGVALALLGGPITAVILVIAGLTAAWIKWGDDIQEVWTKTVDKIKGIFAKVKMAFIAPIKAMMETVKSIMDKAPDWMVPDGLSNGVDAVLAEFRRMEDEAVGHSIIPDMVSSIEEEMKYLKTAMSTPAKEASDEVINSFDNMESTVINSIKGVIKGTMSLKDAFRNIGSRFADNLMDDSINNILGSFDIGKIFKVFDGGGYTGAGTRTGGVDNKGGFPAILHPNETVVDHTKGSQLSSTAENNVNISFNITANDTEGFDNLIESRRGMIVNLINQAMNDRGTLGVT